MRSLCDVMQWGHGRCRGISPVHGEHHPRGGAAVQRRSEWCNMQHLKQFLNTICLYFFSMLSHVVSFFFYTLYIFIRFKHVCTDFANITQLRTEGHADVRHDRWQDSSHSQRALDARSLNLLQYFITSSRHILGTSLALWFSLLRLRPPVGQDPHFHWEALPRSDSVPFHQY